MAFGVFGRAMRARFTLKYVLPAAPKDVYNFFLNAENISTAWPPELGMKVVRREGDLYLVRFRFLGQSFVACFRIMELGDMRMYQESVDFPFGRLRHWITVEKAGDSGSLLMEVLELSSWNPFAAPIFGRVLQYRRQAILHAFGVGPHPVYRDPLKLSTAAGNLLCVAGIVAALVLLLVGPSPVAGSRLLIGLIAFLLLWFFPHDLAHYIVGRVVGVRFSAYYVGLSNIVRLNILPKPLMTLPIALGIKIDREGSRASPKGFAAMYLAGPLASMLLPLTAPVTILTASPSSLAGLLLLSIALANIAFTAYFSPKKGCIAKALKALKTTHHR